MKENKFTRAMVEDYANKLLIGLTKEETDMVLEEFMIIDEHINKINDIKGLENNEPMTHCLDRYITELRDDTPEETQDINDILSNCDLHNDREVKLPKVVG